MTLLPTVHEKTLLNKREFHDALAIRYRWKPKYLPQICECGKAFSVDHAMICSTGGFIHARHDELKETIANILSEVCKDVCIEPSLLEVNGERFENSTNTQDEARLDIAARSFWQRGQRAFFDVRVFYPFARTHVNRDLAAVFKSNENEKKRIYNRRVIEIEHGSFTPLVFSSLGGCSREAEIFLKKLCELVAVKRNFTHSKMMNWLRHKISYILMRSAVLCLRGSRRVVKYKIDTSNVELHGQVLK